MLRPLVHGRVTVFIDAANLEQSLKDLGWHLAYRRLYGYLQTETMLQAVRHYCPRFNDPGQDRFFALLKRTGFTLVTKPLKTIRDLTVTPGHFRKANFDVEIALDAWDLRADYDTCVLFSGDSDFDYLLKRLRAAGKRVVVVSTRHHVAKELVASAHRFVDLRHLRPFIERTGQGP